MQTKADTIQEVGGFLDGLMRKKLQLIQNMCYIKNERWLWKIHILIQGCPTQDKS